MPGLMCTRPGLAASDAGARAMMAALIVRNGRSGQPIWAWPSSPLQASTQASTKGGPPTLGPGTGVGAAGAGAGGTGPATCAAAAVASAEATAHASQEEWFERGIVSISSLQ